MAVKHWPCQFVQCECCFGHGPKRYSSTVTLTAFGCQTQVAVTGMLYADDLSTVLVAARKRRMQNFCRLMNGRGDLVRGLDLRDHWLSALPQVMRFMCRLRSGH